jgi:hypothetical protein
MKTWQSYILKAVIFFTAMTMMTMSYTHFTHSNLFFSSAVGMTVLSILLIIPSSISKLYSPTLTYDDLNVQEYMRRKFSDDVSDDVSQSNVKKSYERAFDIVAITIMSLGAFAFTYTKLFRTEDIGKFSNGQIIALLSGALHAVAKIQSTLLPKMSEGGRVRVLRT